MSKKVLPRLTIAPLQRVVAEPITDPAEQAALDKSRRREKKSKDGQKAKTSRNGAKAASRTTARGRG